MNKIILTSHTVLDLAKSTSGQLIRRISCFFRREPFVQPHGPQWQQLELPFSRTPVRRWNR